MGKETFFTEADKLQEQGQSDAFGPINSSEFRTSSRHRCSEKATAFAVADGHLVAVRQRPDDASSLLNLILIPHGMKHPEVRCFVYINVDSESYFTQDGNFLNTEAQAHNDLISRIIKAHGENASAYTVLCTDDNADYDITDTERMMLSLNGNQPWPVREGDKIGRFNAGEIGFETVLKSMDFPFTLTDAKAANPAIAKDGDSDKEAERRSLMFEDPAVLFPKHKDKFAYGNYVYLDIRIADGLPYRHAYEAPETTLTEDGGEWPIARCLPQNNKVDFRIRVLNEDVTGAAVSVRGADSLAGNRDSEVVKWIKDLEAGNDGLSRISIGVEAPRRVQIRILPEANENSSADFVHKHPLDMVFGDYVENIEKVKKMAGSKQSGIDILPITQRETYINHNGEIALLKTGIVIETYIKDDILMNNRIYRSSIEHLGNSRIFKRTIDSDFPFFLNYTENESFFELHNREIRYYITIKKHGVLTHIDLTGNKICPDYFLCMTEQEANLFDDEIENNKTISSYFKLTRKGGYMKREYEIRQAQRTIEGEEFLGNVKLDVLTTNDEFIFATKEYLKSTRVNTFEIYHYNPTDHIAKAYIEPKGKQVSNSCVPATMEYVNHLWGGKEEESKYWKLFKNKFYTIPSASGILHEHTIAAIEICFVTTECSNIKSAIDAGCVIFSTIYNGGHSVAIVGYTESGDYIYFNPEYDKYEYQQEHNPHAGWEVADPSNFTSAYNIAVTGPKYFQEK